ncbi:M20 metallopeptidase family protein [Janthinobacterium agaricidamnosum]|uniref:Amidohydrolase family protein n=1 Tax=Janthinobacterium agaricidamnosum NBRC 102515 = DSM 9628 TaxID=1349767 RepID=W0V5Z0_9BURK|nr:amidohydrolase [Janthinobacterium agaricidamnosum]CDG82995.1 amidohydrolase family protein [Janthinobacterium agaricidamnosum NBRC 102515 = DSM 9628]
MNLNSPQPLRSTQQAVLHAPGEPPPGSIASSSKTDSLASAPRKNNTPVEASAASLQRMQQSQGGARSRDTVPPIRLSEEVVQRVRTLAAGVMPAVVAYRQDIHQHPELSGAEVRTAGVAARHLRGLGIDTEENVGGHGVVGTLQSGKPRKVVALRADMDALPLQEATQLPFSSENPGVMHGCGHDGHTAMLMGAASVLTQMQSEGLLQNAAVKFIFQPAEEKGTGAKAMIAAGVMKGVDVIFGHHIHPGLRAGEIHMLSGPLLAAANALNVSFTEDGNATQVSHKSLLSVAHTVKALNKRNSPIGDPNKRDVVATPTTLGNSKRPINVSPEFATVSAEIRVSGGQQAAIEEEIGRMANNVADKAQQTVEVTFSPTASADTTMMQATFHGKPTHAGMPEAGKNPVLPAAKMARRLEKAYNQQDVPVHVTLKDLRDSAAPQEGPPVARLGASVRTFGEDVRTNTLDGIQRHAVETAAAMGQKSEVNLLKDGNYSTTDNPEAETTAMQQALSSAGEQVRNGQRVTASEDFSEYQKVRNEKGDVIPGVFSLVGAGWDDREPKNVSGHHQPKFDFNEAAMEAGIRSLVLQTLSYLEPAAGAAR